MANWKELYEKFGEFPDEIPKKFMEQIEFMKINNLGTFFDLGCGTGRYSLLAASLGFDVIGGDYSNKAIEICNEKIKLNSSELKIKFQHVDMFDLKFKPNFFDNLIAIHSIQHANTKQVEEVFRSITRILKTKGLVFIVVPSLRNRDYSDKIKVDKYTYQPKTGLEKGVNHHYFDEKEIRILLKEFEIINLEYYESSICG